jgi:hypothetical protein
MLQSFPCIGRQGLRHFFGLALPPRVGAQSVHKAGDKRLWRAFAPECDKGRALVHLDHARGSPFAIGIRENPLNEVRHLDGFERF